MTTTPLLFELFTVLRNEPRADIQLTYLFRSILHGKDRTQLLSHYINMCIERGDPYEGAVEQAIVKLRYHGMQRESEGESEGKNAVLTQCILHGRFDIYSAYVTRYYTDPYIKISYDNLVYAIFHRRLDMIQFIYQHGCIYSDDFSVIQEAIATQDIKVIHLVMMHSSFPLIDPRLVHALLWQPPQIVEFFVSMGLDKFSLRTNKTDPSSCYMF